MVTCLFEYLILDLETCKIQEGVNQNVLLFPLYLKCVLKPVNKFVSHGIRVPLRKFSQLFSLRHVSCNCD